MLEGRTDQFDRILAVDAWAKDKPSGTIRITTAEHAADTVLWPKLEKFLPEYPDIKVEIFTDYGLTDIVAQRFDAGIRLGDQVAKDMIAVRIAPDIRIAVVGSPSYFARRPLPMTPHDLTLHDCINLRLPTYGGLLVWEFEKNGHALNVRVDGQLVFNSSAPRLRASLAGFGLALLPEDMAQEHIAAGRLQSVLKDWCPTFPGYHMAASITKCNRVNVSLLVAIQSRHPDVRQTPRSAS
ncbi:LysR substrate-binding domain-containing protein [Crenobacter sp. SG2303]|uniref:LysR substrate-binding domain-containing protein n=1 Tax=Crenobacter oryzisoli TaxID=3056844 RepID=A0ABT7XIQ2_9NEIS|nr:LysR substrate-binding domain-containing protein [Crenobacter sp. SG2303]MDN0073668.1 LysR substrate-binding domain-containing protein [Crenobacter sp. SG2303]